MSGAPRRQLILTPIGDHPEVGRWLAALEEARRETLRELAGVTPEMVDWYPSEPLNSIGSLLYHIALIEADWVATEVLESPEPEDLAELLPWPDRDATPGRGNERHLSRTDGQSVAEHVDRLAGVRKYTLRNLRAMTPEEFHRVRVLPEYEVAPDWVLHHLLQHEAEHRAHIAWLRDTYPGS